MIMPKVDFYKATPGCKRVWKFVDGFLVGPATQEETAEYERNRAPEPRACETCGGTGRCASGAV